MELTRAQIVLMGNRAGAGGRYRIGHSVVKDALDLDGIYEAVRRPGLELPERPRAEDLGGRLVNCFVKCEADHRGAVVVAAAVGDPAVFVSVGAMHQGPYGGGPVIAIVDVGE